VRAIILAVCCWPTVAAAAGEEDPRLPEMVQVRVGFANRYKVGYWTPIEVTLRGGTRPALGMLRVVVPDADGDATLVGTPDGRPTAVLPGQTVSVLLYAKIGRDLDGLRIDFDLLETGQHMSFQDDGQFLAAAAEPTFYLIVGSAAPLLQVKDFAGIAEPPEQAMLPGSDRLPTRWYGYDAVDTVVFVVGDGSNFRTLRADTAQMQALTEWLSLGGRLVLLAGSEATNAFERGSGLARLVPGKVTGVETVKDVEALEKFARAAHRIPLAARDQAHGLLAARLERPQGMVDVEGSGLPLVVRTAHGFGETLFFACDLNRGPLAHWQDRGKLVHALLDGNRRLMRESDLKPHSVNFGYSDLAGQLRGALDQFQGIKLVPFWVVGLSIVGYIVLIGPVDYFFVKRVLKRMELTWITFPIIVLAVSVSAFAAAQWAKGSQLRINQIDLVDVDATSGLVRGTTWLNVFSPRTSLYDLSLEPCGPASGEGPSDKHGEHSSPAPPSGGRLFSWLGLPGFNWGGMPAGNGNAGWFRRPYVFGPQLDELQGVPIDVWSTKSFVGRWQAHIDTQGDADLLGSELSVGSDGNLTGRVVSRLPFKLEHCLLTFDRWAWSLGDLPPGPTAVPQAAKRDLQTVLRGFHTVKGQAEEGIAWQPVPYNTGGLEIGNILQQMMFYRAADARSYTSLTNRYQNFVDLSHELALGRAILVGQTDTAHPAARLLESGTPLEGEQQRWVYYRFVLPVTPKP
jgi:hypothetical protein